MWWDREQEEGSGGDVGAAGDEEVVAGERGGEVLDSPFFSEEWEERDSRLPIGVVLGLLLNVSPSGGEQK